MAQEQTLRAVTVVKKYITEYEYPLIVSEGDVLTLGGHDTQWVGWVWCWNAAGKGGWVAERFLATNSGDTIGTMLQDYNATELMVNVGETLTVQSEESGWLWCANERGQQGWIPAENVKPL